MRLKRLALAVGGVVVSVLGSGGLWQVSDAAYPVPPVPTTRGAVITPHAQFVTGNQIYVSPTGNDTTGNGTQTAPYKTLAKAMAASKAGDLLRLMPGTYVLDKTLMWAPKRSIVGAGQSKTFIKPSDTFQPFLGSLIWATRDPGQDPVPFDGKQSIRLLTLLGGGKKVATGIHMWGRNHVLFDRLAFRDFGTTALDVGGPVARVADASNDVENPSLARGIEIANSTFTNCAKETGSSNQYWSGAITFRQTDGILIHDNVIREPLGGGIKNTTSRTFRSRIYHNTIRMTGTAEKPYNNSASMEIWDLRNDNRIYKNNVNAWFSFVHQWVSEDKIPAGDNLLIYDNVLVATPRVTHLAHAMEIALKGAKIYRNRIGGFEYSAFWMEGWESPRTADIDIYRNYVYNEGG